MRLLQVLAVRPEGASSVKPVRRVAIAAAIAALSLVPCATARAAAPAPCNGVTQISDASGDGHHANSDVLSAWFSEQAGRLQAVIKVSLGDWRPAHEDSPAAGFAVLFEVAGQIRYVRLATPQSAPLRYDFGTWTLAGGFASAGTTTGEVATGQSGTVTLDVPAETGATAGVLLARPFVLTSDGQDSPTQPHWVDRAPGGVSPTEAAFGADYVVGSCQTGLPGGPGDPGTTPGSGATTAVVLTAPARRTGTGTVRASGRIVPARGGVTVRVTAKARHSRTASIVRSVKTAADGSFGASIPLKESSAITAVAGGINAQTVTVTLRSRIKLEIRRLRSGKTSVTGTVSPWLPGRVLLLRSTAVKPSATTTAAKGRFRFPARRLVRGRYQAVFIPTGNRAERSTSKTGAVR